jgi:hypothetical protein
MSLKLFDIELSYQNLKYKLESPASAKYKLLSIKRFISQIIDEIDQSKYHSYYLDILPIYSDIILKESISSTVAVISPEEFDKLLELNTKLKKLTIFRNKEKEFQNINDLLEKSKKRSLNICNNNLTIEPLNFDIEKMSSNSLPIVLLENPGSAKGENGLITGVIHTLRLSLSRRSERVITNLKASDGQVDKIELNNLFNINEIEIIKHLNLAVEVAKKVCKKQQIDIHHYNFTFYFDEKDYIYTGTSIGIGAICLAYNAILINELADYYFKFRNDIVFTAEIDNEGNLIKLDEKTLKIKLKTVFFSPYKKLVIPEDNISEAKEELKKLNEKYPNKKLELIPVRQFENVFKNLDIVERYKLKFIERTKVKLKGNERRITIVAIAVSLLILFWFIASYLIPHMDKNPISYQYSNHKLIAQNKYGIKIWESILMDEINDFELTKSGYKDHRVVLTNRETGSSKNDIVFLNRSDSNLTTNRSIFCYSADDRLVWEYTVPRRTIIYNDSVYNDNLILKGIQLMIRKNTKYIVYYGWFSDWFPSTIGMVDLKGNFISEFWNSGFLNTVRIIDINNNGINEVYAGGCNNLVNINCAALTVFDPDLISGASPFTDPLGNGKQGLEKYYLIFPKTVIWKYWKRPRNNVDQIIKNNNNQLTVIVGEDETGDAGIFYNFDVDMNLISAGPSDIFYVKLKDLVRENKITQDEADKYPAILKENVQWWDGEKFVNHRVINKWYTEIKSKN